LETQWPCPQWRGEGAVAAAGVFQGRTDVIRQEKANGAKTSPVEVGQLPAGKITVKTKQ